MKRETESKREIKERMRGRDVDRERNVCIFSGEF